MSWPLYEPHSQVSLLHISRKNAGNETKNDIIITMELRRSQGGGGVGGEESNTCVSLFWISNAVLSLIEEKAMLLSVLYYSNCVCDFPHCCHSFNPSSCHFSIFHLSCVIFQGHVDCRNFTLTRPMKINLDYNNLSYSLLLPTLLVWNWKMNVFKYIMVQFQCSWKDSDILNFM